MIFLQKKGGKVLKQVDVKLTPEEAAQEVLGRSSGFTCFATDGYRLEPRRSFSEQGISDGETVLISM